MTPGGHLAILETYLAVVTEEGCSWHLADKARDSGTDPTVKTPNVMAEKPSISLWENHCPHL